MDPPSPASSEPRYEVLLQIASGGMATVFVGRLRGASGFQRLVAIKRMHPHVAADAQLAAAFLDEARIASLLRHPNVVTVYDVYRSEAEGEPRLVMDYIEGSTLASVLAAGRRQRRRVSRAVAVEIAVHVLRGLHAAHEQKSLEGATLGIVHRDATPHNVLLGIDGSVRVTDFGIARAAERSVDTVTGTLKGKLGYMSPEQARSEPVDRRTDVFAAGVLLYELLTGARMYRADTDAALLRATSSATFTPLLEMEPSTPPALEALVSRALAADREARFPTAQSFANALEGWATTAGERASAQDIAEVVQAMCGPAVEKRRQDLQEALSRGPAALRVLSVSESPLVATPSAAGKARSPGRARSRMFALPLGALLLGGLSAWLFCTRRTEPPIDAAAASTSLPVLPTPPSSSASGSAPSDEVAPSPDAPVHIRVVSGAPIEEVQAPGITGLLFERDGARFELPRSETPVTLSIRLQGHREVRETVTPSSDAVIRLSAAPGKAAAPRRPAPPRAANPESDGLKPSPY